MFEKKKLSILRGKVMEMQKLKIEHGVYSMFNSYVGLELMKTDDYRKLNYLFRLFCDIDKRAKIPHEVGKLIDSYVESPDFVVAIHREKIFSGDEKNEESKYGYLIDILKNGQFNNGHFEGVNENAPSPSLSVTPLKQLGDYVNLFSNYKNNNCTIVYAFPSTLVSEDCQLLNENAIEEVYNIDSNKYRFKPEFIIGILVKQNNGPDIFYTRDELLDLKNS